MNNWLVYRDNFVVYIYLISAIRRCNSGAFIDDNWNWK